MNKVEFLNEIKIKLNGTDEKELDEIINYYDEIISDAVESGKTEEEFILGLGSVETVLKRADAEKKVKDVNEKPTMKNKFSAIFAIFGIITSPIWLTIIAAFFMVIIALILSGFAVILSLGISVVALLIALIASIILSVTMPQALVASIAIIGAMIFLIGLVIVASNFLFNTVVVGMINLFKKMVFRRN